MSVILCQLISMGSVTNLTEITHYIAVNIDKCPETDVVYTDLDHGLLLKKILLVCLSRTLV